ncbi:MAG: GNAT family N-acetyltransferase [Gammaproteobacteria bacterium]|nr:GNAT family N-acetyltransferase [Gammaproteobacteria bacterium]
MTNYVTRTATTDDETGLDALLSASYSTLMKPAYSETLSEDALQLMTKSNPTLLASGTFYVAEAEDSMLVGCGGWTIERPGDGKVEDGVGHVRHFATHPDWVGRGIGQAIYALCETNAGAAGVTVFECFSSLNAERFYASLGFARVRETDVELTTGVTVPGIVMRRRI